MASIDTESTSEQASIVLSTLPLPPQPSGAITKDRPSFIWGHHYLGRNVEFLRGSKSIWVCKYCYRSYIATGGTNSQREHLETHGHFDSGESTRRKQSTKRSYQRIDQAIESVQSNINKWRRIEEDSLVSYNFKQEAWETLFLEWIAGDSISFSMCESPQFRAMMTYTNMKLQIPTRNTAKLWELQYYERRKLQLKEEILFVKNKVHLSIDIWTSTNNVAYMAIIAHYLDQSTSRRSPILRFQPIQGQHTGENQSMLVLKALVEYNLLEKLGYVMLDNASNNDTLMRHLQAGK